jgi:hypothetical protein
MKVATFISNAEKFFKEKHDMLYYFFQTPPFIVCWSVVRCQWLLPSIQQIYNLPQKSLRTQRKNGFKRAGSKKFVRIFKLWVQNLLPFRPRNSSVTNTPRPEFCVRRWKLNVSRLSWRDWTFIPYFLPFSPVRRFSPSVVCLLPFCFSCFPAYCWAFIISL